MKNTYLSNFQKEQYTNYLETQLQKFSAFMLSQRKQNEKYLLLQNIIQEQSHQFQQMQEKLELLDFYQQENFKQSQIIARKQYQIESIQNRLCKMENMIQKNSNFQFQDNRKKISKSVLIAQNLKVCQDHENNQCRFEKIDKKIKKIQSQLQNNKQRIANVQFHKSKSRSPIKTQSNQLNTDNLVDKKDMKKWQKKMQKYISSKMDNIQQIITTVSTKKRNKSPSTRSPTNFRQNSQIEQSHKILSQFVIEDNPSLLSYKPSQTRSHTSVNSKKIQKKPKNKQNRSKSKSKKKSKKQKKINNKSIDKSRSRSKSNISESNISKKSKKCSSKLKGRIHSNSVSDVSSISVSKSISRKKIIDKKQRDKAHPKNQKQYLMYCKKKHF